MHLKQLHYFLAVAEEGSFSKAATVLHMTQPPLSLAIAQLESELGVRLLERHPYGVSKTPAGEFLAVSGAELMQRVTRIEGHLKDLGQGIAGRLQLAAVPSFSWSLLPPLLKAYTEQSPGVVVELSDPSPPDVLNQVTAGIADVGIVVTGSATELQEEYAGELHVALIQPMPLVAVLPPRYRNAPEAVDLGDLMAEQWMVPQPYAGFPGLIELMEAAWLDMKQRPADVRMVSTLQTALPLIAAGMGIGIMPASISEVAGSSVVIREFIQDVRPLEGTLVWSRRHTVTPATQRFLDLVLSHSSARGI